MTQNSHKSIKLRTDLNNTGKHILQKSKNSSTFNLTNLCSFDKSLDKDISIEVTPKQKTQNIQIRKFYKSVSRGGLGTPIPDVTANISSRKSLLNRQSIFKVSKGEVTPSR